MHISEMQSLSLIKVAAVAAILALGGLGPDAFAHGRLFDGRHFGHGERFTGKLHDHGRRVSPDRPPAAMRKFPPATVCKCTELSCCDGGFSDFRRHLGSLMDNREEASQGSDETPQLV